MATFYLKVKPNAARSLLTRTSDGALLLRIAAPANEGKANAAIEAFLAKAVLGVAKSAVTIVGGHTAPLKKIEVSGLTEAEITERLTQKAV
jgi:uncharacterized protein